MSKGENIFKRKDGRWEARYIKARDAAGKIKYGYCYGKTYREAKDKVMQKKAMVYNGILEVNIKTEQSLSVHCDQWLQSRKYSLKPSTIVKYETILRRHIKRNLGDYRPSSITPATVDAFILYLMEHEKLSPKTVKDILIVLRSILKYVSKQRPGSIICADFSYPKCPKKEKRVLTSEEQQKLVAYLREQNDACSFGILLAMATGLRIGELCALKWESICLKSRTLSVRTTMQRLQQSAESETKTKVVISSPKSESSQRLIPLSDYIYQLCLEQMPKDVESFVLTGTLHYMEPRTLQYRLKKYADACGLKDIHFHALRHTFATRCVEVGFEIKSLSEILGHASTTLTLDRYVHSSMNLKRENMNKLKAIGF